MMLFKLEMKLLNNGYPSFYNLKDQVKRISHHIPESDGAISYEPQ